MNKPFLIVRASERAVDEVHEKHGFIRQWSLSPDNTGFGAMRMCAGTIPPRTETTPHWHTGCETAIFIMKGRVKILIGRGLSECYYAGPGDFIYVPKGVIHQTITLDEPCFYVQVVDNAEEGTVEYDPAQDDFIDESSTYPDDLDDEMPRTWFHASNYTTMEQ